MRGSPFEIDTTTFKVSVVLAIAASAVLWQPPAPAAATTAVLVTGSWEHTCVVTSAAGVRCWGSNTSGQLGSGTIQESSGPVDVCAVGGCPAKLTAVVSVSAAPTGETSAIGHTCALTETARVLCWGANLFGGLGNGTTADSAIPVEVCASGATYPCGANVLQDITEMSTHGPFVCAVTTSATVKCWGRNGDGQLGNGTTVDSSTPVDVLEVCAQPQTNCGSKLLTGLPRFPPAASLSARSWLRAASPAGAITASRN